MVFILFYTADTLLEMLPIPQWRYPRTGWPQSLVPSVLQECPLTIEMNDLWRQQNIFPVSCGFWPEVRHPSVDGTPLESATVGLGITGQVHQHANQTMHISGLDMRLDPPMFGDMLHLQPHLVQNGKWTDGIQTLMMGWSSTCLGWPAIWDAEEPGKPVLFAESTQINQLPRWTRTNDSFHSQHIDHWPEHLHKLTELSMGKVIISNVDADSPFHSIDGRMEKLMFPTWNQEQPYDCSTWRQVYHWGEILFSLTPETNHCKSLRSSFDWFNHSLACKASLDFWRSWWEFQDGKKGEIL